MFSVELFQLRKLYTDLSLEEACIREYLDAIERVYYYFNSQVKGMDNDIVMLRRLMKELQDEEFSLKQLMETLDSICEIYESAETRVIDLGNEEVILFRNPDIQWTNLERINSFVEEFFSKT